MASSAQFGLATSYEDRFRGFFVWAIVLHVLLAVAVFAAAWIHFDGSEWGSQGAASGAIQATMVSSLPLPNRQRDSDTGVLTSEAPSPAPVTAKEKTEAAAPDTIAIPDKTRAKTAEKTEQAPPKRPQPSPNQPTKAQTGETAGVRIPQSTMDLRNGTASTAVQDRNFGARYSYYVNIVNQKVARNWFTTEADPRASEGRSVTIVFDINRDGKPSNPRVTAKSGSPSLDQSALRAVQRVQDEGFGPLPAGDHISVEFTFHYTQP